MATSTASNRCETNAEECKCTGCKKFFSVERFIEHRHQLSWKFDHEVVRPYDELLDQINKGNQSNDSYADLFSQIDRWEIATIKKIQEASARVRQQLTDLINGKREILREQIGKVSKKIRRRQEEDNFVEDDVEQLRQEIIQLQQSLAKQTLRMVVILNDEIDWNHLIFIEKAQERASPLLFDIDPDARWTQNGVTVAGGNGCGHELNQLSSPCGLRVVDDQILYIADFNNDRIMEWRCGATSGQVVAGGNGQGNWTDQLNYPTDVIVDKQTNSVIVCDKDNRRVVRWPRRGGTSGQTIISDVNCTGLAMDDIGFLYVSDCEKSEVRQWRVGETSGTVVAGGNGRGHRLDQLSYPEYVFVDRDHSVYVSDSSNHRVMRWVKGAKEGIIVAGGEGEGNALTQLSFPRGVVVDQLGTVYVADCWNHRIMRWPKGATQGSIVIGGNGPGEQVNQLDGPVALSFDRQGNLYVVDEANSRVQRFSIERHS